MNKKINSQISVAEKEITNLEKKNSSILDLLENSKNNQGSGLGFNLSKKTIKETDFDSFLTYINYLSLKKETKSKREVCPSRRRIKAKESSCPSKKSRRN